MLFAVALVLTACDGAPDGEATPSAPGHTSASPSSDDNTTGREGSSTGPSDPTAVPTGDTKVVGTAESVGDVGSQDPTPMTDGTLLVLSRGEADHLWELVEYTPSDSELPYVSGLLERSDVEQWQLVPIADGRFGFDAPDGDYLVCLLTGDLILNGCAEATVTGPSTWVVSHGEGGFEARR